MKAELTEAWNPVCDRGDPTGKSSVAMWHDVRLASEALPSSVWGANRWIGEAMIAPYGNLRRTGPIRKSAAAARRDAEKLAVELLLDIREAARALMVRHGISED